MSLKNVVVFWDFDGTLAFREGMWGSALLDSLREVRPNSQVSKADLSPHLQTGFPWHEPDTPHLHLCRPDDWWSHMRSLLAGALVRAGVDESDAVVCTQIVRERFLCPSAWTLYDDAIPALEMLSELGGTNVILSNHVPELEWLVGELGLAQCVDGVLTSALTGYEKPHCRAFELGLQYAGNPVKAYMVGDNPVADVAGAEAVGIKGILVCRKEHAACAERIVSTLIDAARMIAT